MTAQEPNKAKKARLPLPLSQLIALFALVVAITSLVIVIYLWQQQQQTQLTTTTAAQQLNHAMSQLESNQNSAKQGFSQFEQQVAEQFGTVNDKLSRLAKRQGDVTKTWELEESQHLIKLAVYNVTLDQNTSQAIKLLTEADNNLKKLGDPDIIPVRKTIAENLAQLHAVPKVDTAGLILRIQALQNQVANLPITASPIPQPISATLQQSEKETWQQRIQETFNSLKNLVVIRRLQEPVKPLLAPDQLAYLVENIQAQLSFATFAVLKQEPQVYRLSLNQASRWVKQYFVENKPTTQSILKALEELQNETIAPHLPNINSSLDAIDQAIKNIATKGQDA